ncbi:MAG: D-tyrosyl-tRNA(Tyr) deacylase [Clostridiales bacterium]|jgi:D-tyrosyl-tRNA(Tyr) deacylase|nr:D-tyrosyl-tRNA(Tyr) deacylase [Clostridiales bacterium]
MRALLQRVRCAKVETAGRVIGEIGPGLLILLGIRSEDTDDDITYLVNKIAHLRIFEDNHGKINLSLLETAGEALIVSQFTLYADTRKGRRPGFSDAAPPDVAEPLYNRFCQAMADLDVSVATGRFGAMMDITLINQGPVTILLESEK